MRAAVYNSTGLAREVLKIKDEPKPVPQKNEVLIALRASGINPADVKRRAGWRNPEMPHPKIIPHCDGAGEVVAVGKDVKDRKVGDRVWVWNAQGGYDGPGRAFGTAAEFIAIDGMQTAILHEKLNFLEGACLGVPAVTAHHAVFADGPVKNQTILVQGGGGVVAHFAIQFAKYGSANVIATTGSSQRSSHALEAGADKVLDRHDPMLSDLILDATGGEGVDRVIELEFGGNLFTDISVLKAGGVIAAYSSTQIPEPTFPYYKLAAKGGAIRVIQSFGFSDEIRSRAIDTINKLCSDNELIVSIGRVYYLDQISQAHDDVEAQTTIGNIVLEI